MYVDALPTLVVALFAFWALAQRRRLPAEVGLVLLAWAFVQLIYAVLAASVDWRLSLVTVMTRVTPMMLSLIAFTSIQTTADFRRFAFWVSLPALLMLPVGMVTVMLGVDALPNWLRAIDSLAESGRELRAGLPAVAGFFTTQWIMSLSMLAITYLSFSILALEHSQKYRVFWWVVAFSSISLVYLSTRRGAFLAAILALVVYMLVRKRPSLQLVTTLVSIMILVLVVDNYGVASSSDYGTRSAFVLDLDFSNRFSSVFLRYTEYWLRTAPLGTYLGYAGAEGRAFGVGFITSGMTFLEVGGAQLAAEMGLLGIVLMPLTIISMILWIFRISRPTPYGPSITLLLMYQVALFILYFTKELLAISNVSMAQFMFWAIPGIAVSLVAQQGAIVRSRFSAA